MSRVLLTGGTVVFAVVVYALMLKGWRSRQRRQSDLPAPPVAAPGATEVMTAEGLFVGTTSAHDWLDRIAVHQLSDRATGVLVLAEDGVHLERDDLPEIWIPRDSLREAGVEQALAGKIMSDGMLVITWQLGERLLASAFRAADHADHTRLRDAITAMITEREAA